MLKPATSIESFSSSYPRIGSDEVGKGDFFGPLVVAAVCLDSPGQLRDIRIADSKKMSDSAIRSRAPLLRQSLRHSLVKILPSRYNELFAQMRNINAILGWAHAQAIKNLLSQGIDPQVMIVDQFGPPIRLLRYIPEATVRERIAFFTHGERDTAVACASMIARSCFLQEMSHLSQEAGLPLPLGAGAPVDLAAKRLAQKIGRDRLHRFVKVHFRNFSRIPSLT